MSRSPGVRVMLRSLSAIGVAILCAMLARPTAAQSTGQVAGHVTSSETGLPLSGVTVQLNDPSGFLRATGGTDASGAYVLTVEGGTYFLSTSNVSGYVDELYDNKHCVAHDCFAPLGTPIVV